MILHKGNTFSNGWLEDINGSGALWTINDTSPGSNGVYGVGSQGSAWFYIANEWTHTWATNKITLNGLSFSYPLSISAQWSSKAGLEKWTVPNQKVYTSW